MATQKEIDKLMLNIKSRHLQLEAEKQPATSAPATSAPTIHPQTMEQYQQTPEYKKAYDTGVRMIQTQPIIKGTIDNIINPIINPTTAPQKGFDAAKDMANIIFPNSAETKIPPGVSTYELDPANKWYREEQAEAKKVKDQLAMKTAAEKALNTTYRDTHPVKPQAFNPSDIIMRTLNPSLGGVVAGMGGLLKGTSMGVYTPENVIKNQQEKVLYDTAMEQHPIAGLVGELGGMALSPLTRLLNTGLTSVGAVNKALNTPGVKKVLPNADIIGKSVNAGLNVAGEGGVMGTIYGSAEAGRQRMNPIDNAKTVLSTAGQFAGAGAVLGGGLNAIMSGAKNIVSKNVPSMGDQKLLNKENFVINESFNKSPTPPTQQTPPTPLAQIAQPTPNKVNPVKGTFTLKDGTQIPRKNIPVETPVEIKTSEAPVELSNEFSEKYLKKINDIQYDYYTKMRPPSPGTQPSKGLINTETFKNKTNDGWGKVTYNRKLTAKEISDYELTPDEFYNVVPDSRIQEIELVKILSKDFDAIKFEGTRLDVILSKSTKGSKYQITTFDKKGVPFSDAQYNTLQEVAERLADDGHYKPTEIKVSKAKTPPTESPTTPLKSEGNILPPSEATTPSIGQKNTSEAGIKAQDTINTGNDINVGSKNENTNDELFAKTNYEDRIVPDGWYVHGRSGKQDLNTGNVIQLTKDWDVADQYAGKNGSVWLISPKDITKTIDVTDPKIRRSILSELIKDYRNGKLEKYGDLEDTIKNLRVNGNSLKSFESELNPKNIVDSAEAWDYPDFISWFNDKFDIDLVKTNDGAVSTNIDNLKKLKVSTDTNTPPTNQLPDVGKMVETKTQPSKVSEISEPVKPVKKTWKDIKSKEDLPDDVESLQKLVDEAQLKIDEIDNIRNPLDKEKALKLMNINLQLFAEAKRKINNISKLRSNTLKRADWAKDEGTQKIIDDANLVYETKSHERSIELSQKDLNNDYDGTYKRLMEQDGIKSSEDSVSAGVITRDLVEGAKTDKKYYAVLSNFLKKVQPQFTKAGQVIEAVKTWTSDTLEGSLMRATKIIKAAEQSMPESRINKSKKGKATKETDEVKKAHEEIIDSVADELDDTAGKTRKPKTKKEIIDEVTDELDPEELLANRIEGRVNSFGKEKPTKETEVLDKIVDELYKKFKQTLPKEKLPPNKSKYQIVADAVRNREVSAEVWSEAKYLVEERFKDNPEALDLINQYFAEKSNPAFANESLEAVIRQSLKDKGFKISDIVKNYYEKGLEQSKSLKEHIISETGLKDVDAEYLAKYIDDNINAKIEKYKNEYLESTYKETVPRDKLNDAFDFITTQSNVDAFDNIKYADKVSGKIEPKLKSLLTEKGIKIKELVLQGIKDTNKTKQDFLAYLESNLRDKVKDTDLQKIVSIADNMFDKMVVEAREGSLAKKIENKVKNFNKEKPSKNNAVLDKMINELYNKFRQTLPNEDPMLKSNKYEVVAKAISNREEYAEVWDSAKRIVKDKFKNDPEALKLVDEYFATKAKPPFANESIDKIIRQGLKDKVFKISDIVKKYYKEGMEQRKNLKEYIIDQTGLKDADAEYLAKYIRENIKAKIKTYKEGYLERLYKEKVPDQKTSTALDFIETQSNMAAFDNVKYADKVANKIEPKIKTLLAENNIKIRDLIKEGVKETASVKEDFMLYLESQLLTKIKKADIGKIMDIAEKTFDEMVKNSRAAYLKSLLKPMPTPNTNVTYLDKIMKLIDLDAFNISEVSELIKQKYGIPGLTASDLQYIGNIYDATIKFDKLSWEYRAGMSNIEKFIQSKLPLDVLNIFKAVTRTNMLATSFGRIKDFAGTTLTAVSETILKNLTYVPIDALTTTFRNAIDKSGNKVLRNYVYSPSNVISSAKGFKTGLVETMKDIKYGVDTNPNIKFEYMQSGRPYSDKYMITRLGNSIDRLVGKSLEIVDRPFTEASKEARINELKKINKDPNVTDDMRLAAAEHAVERYLMNDSRIAKWVENLKSSDNSLLYKIAANMILPFVRWPSNALVRMFEYSGGGLIKGVGHAMKSTTETFNQKYFVENIGRGLGVSGLLYVGYKLYRGGYLRASFESNQNVEQLNLEEGKMPYSLSIGDTSHDIQWGGPTVNILLLGAEIAKGVEKKKEYVNKQDSYVDELAKGAESAGNSFLNMGVLQGVTRMFKGYSPTAQIANSFLTSTTQIQPTMGKRIAAYFDDYERETRSKSKVETYTNKFQAGIPGFRDDLPIKYKITGEPQMSKKSDIYSAFLSPGQVSKHQNNPTLDEVYRLYKATGETGFIPKVATTEITIPKSSDYAGKYILTTKDISEYQRILGTETMKNINTEISDYYYQFLEDYEKANALTKAVTDANKIAKEEIAKNIKSRMKK